MNHPFNGATQNANAWNVDQIDGYETRLRRQLQLLQAEQARLHTHIYSQQAQDEEAMKHLDEVEEAIRDVQQQIQDLSQEGGRRKRHRQTKRHAKRQSKSRVKKSRAKKSRRSKH